MKREQKQRLKSSGFILKLAADCLQQDGRNPKLIEDMRTLSAVMKEERRGHYSEDEERRIDRQRTLFNMLPTGGHKDKLKRGMLQRAYDLLWDGDTQGCDALLEFLPSDDVGPLLDAWSADVEVTTAEEARSIWYHDAGAVI